MRRTSEGVTEATGKVTGKTAGPHQLRPADVAAASLLTSAGSGRSSFDVKARQAIMHQGERAAALYYIHRGKVQLVVVSEQGKEAVIGILGPGDFFGEGCVAGRSTYHSSAIAMTDCGLVRIERDAMLRLLRDQPLASEAFMRFLLSRSVRIEADLIDQLFNSSERRLARALLQLADFGARSDAEVVIPRVSQEVLAAKVGTTRSRVNFFMNKFRKLGLVDYDIGSGTLTVRRSLLDTIIQG